MADPGPAASPGVTHAWIRVMILSIRSPRYPSIPSMTTQMLFQQIPENVSYSRKNEVGIHAKRLILMSHLWTCLIFQWLSEVPVKFSFSTYEWEESINFTGWQMNIMLYLWQYLAQYFTTMWEMHFPAVLLFRAVPWHFKNVIFSGTNGPIFAWFLSPKATKEDREETGGKKSTVFTTVKAVSKCILHLCSLQGPPSLSSLVPLTSWRAEWLRGATPAFYPAREGLPLSIVKNINCRGVVKTRKTNGREVKCHIFPWSTMSHAQVRCKEMKSHYLQA